MLSLDVSAVGGMVVSLLGLVYLLRTTNDRLLHRIAVVKRHDRTLRNWQFALVIVLVVAAEVAFCRWLQVQLEFAILFGALTLYLPCTFFVYCNVYHVGSRRELIWSCVFLFACSLSLYRREDISRLLVLPTGIATTALLCFGAARDPYCHYRRGLRELDEHHAGGRPRGVRDGHATRSPGATLPLSPRQGAARRRGRAGRP